MSDTPVIPFEDLRRQDVGLVGGKNASLGELISQLTKAGVRVPPGFATTAAVYRGFLDANNLLPLIRSAIEEYETGARNLAETGSAVREAILRGAWPAPEASAIIAAYRSLCQASGKTDAAVAVRSSATAEDLPDASFAGQQETYLNVRGELALLNACRRCFASLFTDRAISYRRAKGFDHMSVALSVGVQMMVRSDLAGSGVMFSIDTETGFDKVVIIDAAYGLGENVVQGAVDPDQYLVFKPFLDRPGISPILERKLGGKAIKMVYAEGSDRPLRNLPTSRIERASFVLSDAEIVQLAGWAKVIEGHYGCPMDMEWAKDGETGELFIVQARPETVQARRDSLAFRSYRVKASGSPVARGIAIGDSAVRGNVCIIENAADIGKFVDGSILVTSTTDPDWVPIMKRARAIVTDHGGRTSHAAIVSRELGVPAIVGTGNATAVLHDEQEVTVSCAEGDEGFVYAGPAEIESEDVDVRDIPPTKTKIMLNMANPAAAFRWWRLPAKGVGLARMEFVISNHIRIHPMALVRFAELRDLQAKKLIEELTSSYSDKTQYFVDKLAQGLARIAAAFFPLPVIVRMSDFKTNEYARLIGGAEFETTEENPMIGFRGASRYHSPRYRDGFALECRAIRRLREEMGFSNVIVMIPFCRSAAEADLVLETMASNGLRRGEHGLEAYVMCEIPSNVILAADFAKRFDGFSIGSNDLTQLTLGIDRDSAELASAFDEQDPAVKWMIRNVIAEAHRAGAKVGLCGQAPSDHPEFARFLVDCGIDSISVSPDSFVAVSRIVAQHEARLPSETQGS
ncbi:phosphoenolpyruvate synthase [Aestuariivirga sp.]|uniref:phosphoenolpyruvate synthase n=1 Tax=Aestuariivirga sp. TaxID=2650926 RepID=UPI00391CD173